MSASASSPKSELATIPTSAEIPSRSRLRMVPSTTSAAPLLARPACVDGCLALGPA